MLGKLSPLAAAITGAMVVATSPAMAVNQIEFKKDSILVVYKNDTTKADRDSVKRALRASIKDTNNDGIDDRFKNLLNGRLAKYALTTGIDIKEAIKKISQHPAVAYAEPNYILHAIATPDDSSLDQLWGLHNEAQTGGTQDADIDATEAWDISTGSKDVVIGVIDTGIDYNHPDLQANIWVNPNEIAGNGVDDDGNGVIDDIHGFNANANSGDPMDGNGHGTHVAGTIGAVGNNADGVVGVNWDVTMIGCQFLDANGSGSTAGAIACIDYFTNLKLNHGVDIKATNNSWGGGSFSQALKDSIAAGGDAGILFIAAAGNAAADNDANASYPSGYDLDTVMAIASTDHNDAMSGFSSYGLTTVDMGAPGSDILSTVPNGGYSSFSGTSMATPHVAGAAALVWSINPELTPVEMKQLLMDSGDANAALTGKTVSGNRLNAFSALEAANPTPSPKLSVTPIMQQVIAGDVANYDFSIASIAGWNGSVDLNLVATPALEGSSLSATSAVVGDVVTLSVPTTAETLWGDYEFTVTASSGDIVKAKTVSLNVLPQGLNDFPYVNQTPVAIPDNDVNGVTSTIEINDPLQVFGVNASLDISHTWIGDLVVSLTSPAGTQAVLHNGSGGSADDIVQSYDLSVFDGEMATGVWTLAITDNAAGDNGTLNSWGFTLTALGEVAPAAPTANFEYTKAALTVIFNNTSDDINDDIVSYEWNFGDGSSSMEMSPTYTYSAVGDYQVSLTVTDSAGQTDMVSQTVSVFENVILAESKRAKKSRRGSALVDLTWRDALGEQVEIYRNGELVKTTNNDGRYRDRFMLTTSSVEYQVCQTERSLCSAPFTVSF